MTAKMKQLSYIDFDDLDIAEKADYVLKLMTMETDAGFVAQLQHLLGCTKKLCDAVKTEMAMEVLKTPENTV